MSPTLKKYYINRNATAIKAFLKLRNKGIQWRTAVTMIANGNYEISESVLNAVLSNKNYSYAKEAWDIVNNDIKPLKNQSNNKAVA